MQISWSFRHLRSVADAEESGEEGSDSKANSEDIFYLGGPCLIRVSA